MTIYLWHWVVTFLLSYGVYLTFRIGLLSQHDAWYWPANVLRLLIVCAVVAVFFVPLRATERRPLPWWDRPVPAMDTGRDIAVGVLVLAGAILTLVYTRIYVIDPHWGGFTPIGRWIVVASWYRWPSHASCAETLVPHCRSGNGQAGAGALGQIDTHGPECADCVDFRSVLDRIRTLDRPPGSVE